MLSDPGQHTPALARAWHVAQPMPEDAPVTMATLSLSMSFTAGESAAGLCPRPLPPVTAICTAVLALGEARGVCEPADVDAAAGCAGEAAAMADASGIAMGAATGLLEEVAASLAAFATEV